MHCDAEGTLWVSGKPAADASFFLQWAERLQIPLTIVTNTVSRTPQRMADEWRKYDLPVRPQSFVTPFDALNIFLERTFAGGRGDPVDVDFVGSSSQTRRLCRRPRLRKNPEWLVFADWESFSWNLVYLNRLLNAVETGSRVAVLSPSTYYRKEGRLYFDTGSFSRLFEPFLKEPPLNLGKPHPFMFEASRRRQDSAAPTRHCTDVVIGDDASTDVRMALDAGAASILLRRGKFSPEEEENKGATWCVDDLFEAARVLESTFQFPRLL